MGNLKNIIWAEIGVIYLSLYLMFDINDLPILLGTTPLFLLKKKLRLHGWIYEI